MLIFFEPTRSFCYRIARYEILNEIAREPEALSGKPFRMIVVTRRVIMRRFTPEQLSLTIPATNSDRVETVYGSIRFFVQLLAKRLPNSPLIWLGDRGLYKLKVHDVYKK